MDNKQPLNKVGITRNDEPTRFLTEEEMEQLERAVYETKSINDETVKPQNVKNTRIKIEDIAIPKTTKSSIKEKTQIYSRKIKNIIKRTCMAISVVLVAILGFYLAFSLSTPVTDNKDEKVISQQERTVSPTDTEQNKQDDLSIKEIKQQAQEKIKVVGKNLDDVKQLSDDTKKDLSTLENIKSEAVKAKTSAQDLVDEHKDELAMLKLEVENLIKKFW